MKTLEEAITESDFLWNDIETFAPNYLKQAEKILKIFNQFNNFCYLSTSFDLKCNIYLKIVTTKNT